MTTTDTATPLTDDELTDDELTMVETILATHDFDESQEANWLASKAGPLVAEVRRARLTEGAGVAAGEPAERELAQHLRALFVEANGHATHGWGMFIPLARAVLSGEWRKGGRP